MFRRQFLAALPGFALAPLAARAASHAEAPIIRIEGFKFVPEVVEITAGHAVEWFNADRTAHTATATDKSFDTKRIRSGDSATVVFREPGTYAYYCRFHRRMKGTVIVT